MCVRLEKTLSIAGVFLGLCAAFWPLGLWYGRRLTDGGDEPLGVVILGLLAVLIFKEKDQIEWCPNKCRLIIAGLFLGLYLLSTFWLPPMLRSVPAILCLVFLLGWQERPSWLALLLLSLPVVASLQFYLGYPLRLISAETTRWLVIPFSHDVVREGSMLTSYGKVVGVDPPCSGIRILWMGMVVANVIAAFYQMKWLRMIAFNLLAITLLLLTNSLRAALLFAPESGAIEIPESVHTGIGMICYLGAVILLIKVATLKSANLHLHTIS